jgi:hypothetical protein
MALWQWGACSMYEPEDQEMVLVDKKSGKPVRPLTLQAQDGRPLGPGEVSFVARGKIVAERAEKSGK